MNGMASSDDLVFVDDRRKRRRNAAGSGVFLAMALLLLLLGDLDEKVRGVPIGWSAGFGVLLFGVAFCLSVRDLMRPPRTLLRLGREGFVDGSLVGGGVWIPWADVVSLRTRDLGDMGAVEGSVVDGAALRRRRPPGARLLGYINRRAEIWITDDALPISASELLTEMTRRWTAATGRRTSG